MVLQTQGLHSQIEMADAADGVQLQVTVQHESIALAVDTSGVKNHVDCAIVLGLPEQTVTGTRPHARFTTIGTLEFLTELTED